ncbi:MAG: 1-acyl-sn-glycerol-3-phosphate acyltransferase, partial [Actinobacteria bacterium]|nr:1-acyl-sn-glycerol-3-phosphate acyltransferase [Actinomycetota bacterium]
MTANRYGDQDVDGVERSKQTLGGRILYWILWRVFYTAILVMFRLRVEGRKNLPEGPFILSGVHRSFIDTPIIGMVTSRRLRFMGKESLWKSKPLGAFLSVMGGFPVERGTADRTALRAAQDVLALGEPLVMFPEGTRQSGPTLHPLFDGPAYVAMKRGVPIVPVGIGGSERV